MTAILKDKIISVIRDIPTLKGLNSDELEMIAPLFIEKTFQPGDFIIVEGTQGDSMYIINRGSVLVTSSDRKGDVVTLGTLKDGAFFGELSLFDNLPRSATVTAIRETSIFMITRSELNKIFSKIFGYQCPGHNGICSNRCNQLIPLGLIEPGNQKIHITKSIP